MAAETLERYLHTRYVGQKRFSLEGGESAIPALDTLTKRLRAQGVEEMVIGMAHRGRLNVLVNLLNKDPAQLFAEFEGKQTIGSGSGDVKYHMGYSSNLETPAGSLHVALAYNPSHRRRSLNPVVRWSGVRNPGRNAVVRMVRQKWWAYLFMGIPRWAASASTKPRLTYRRLRATALAVRYIW